MNILLYFIFFVNTNALIMNTPFLLGTYILRTTNDNKIKDHYSFLILNDDDTFKIKTLVNNNFFVTKISNTGKIVQINYYNIFDNSIEIETSFYRKNKYSYSIFNIELPKIKVSNKNYITKKKFIIKKKDKSLFIRNIKSGEYYIFEQSNNIKMPFIEMTVNSILTNQIISFIINLILVKIITLNN